MRDATPSSTKDTLPRGSEFRKPRPVPCEDPRHSNGPPLPPAKLGPFDAPVTRSRGIHSPVLLPAATARLCACGLALGAPASIRIGLDGPDVSPVRALRVGRIADRPLTRHVGALIRRG